MIKITPENKKNGAGYLKNHNPNPDPEAQNSQSGSVTLQNFSINIFFLYILALNSSWTYFLCLGKLASIFLGKKEKPPPEDPAKVAARRAFLLSSAPDELRYSYYYKTDRPM